MQSDYTRARRGGRRARAEGEESTDSDGGGGGRGVARGGGWERQEVGEDDGEVA